MLLGVCAESMDVHRLTNSQIVIVIVLSFIVQRYVDGQFGRGHAYLLSVSRCYENFFRDRL